MAPEFVALLGAAVGALIGFLSAYGNEILRERRYTEKRRQQVARTIASEIHSHNEAIEKAIDDEVVMLEKVLKSLSDQQWQAFQNEIWGLQPDLGIRFRKYYDQLEWMKGAFPTELKAKISEGSLESLLELAKDCLRMADFPIRSVRIRMSGYATDRICSEKTEQEIVKTADLQDDHDGESDNTGD